MSLSDWITLLTAAGGAITALAALFTVVEMRRQRRSNYLPDVLLRAPEFQVFGQHPAGMEGYSLSTEARLPLSEGERRVAATCQILNAGFGPARHVELEWDLDVSRLREHIKATVGPDVLRLVERGNLLEVHGVSSPPVMHNLDAQRHDSILVVPAQQAEPVHLPWVYVDVLARYLGALAESPLRRSGGGDPPSIDLLVTFEDLESARIAQRFRITPEVVSISIVAPGEQRRSLCIATGYFKAVSLSAERRAVWGGASSTLPRREG